MQKYLLKQKKLFLMTSILSIFHTFATLLNKY